MLNINMFDLYKDYNDSCACPVLTYFGECTGYMYSISQDVDCFMLHIEDLDENGDAHTIHHAHYSALSAAIAAIEALENGEKI